MEPFGVLDMVVAVLATLALPFGVVLLFEFREWRERRRLNDGAVVVQFEPPSGLSPTETGVLIDGEAHQRDVLATVFDLANRGYLRVREVSSSDGAEDHELTLLRSDFREDAQLKPHESYILGLVFGAGKQAMIGDVIHSGILTAAKGVIEKRVFGQMAIPGYFRDSPVRKNPEHFRQVFIGLLSPALLLMIAPALNPGRPATIGFLFAASVVASLWLVFIYGRIKYTVTAAGLEARRQALGFREYLLRAEKYRLEWQITEQVFSAYMPYALAFDVLEPFLHASYKYADDAPEWFETSQGFRNAQRVTQFVRDVVGLSAAFGASLSALANKKS